MRLCRSTRKKNTPLPRRAVSASVHLRVMLKDRFSRNLEDLRWTPLSGGT